MTSKADIDVRYLEFPHINMPACRRPLYNEQWERNSPRKFISSGSVRTAWPEEVCRQDVSTHEV